MSLRERLIRHENLKNFPYKDSRGKLTIGVGRCLDTRGITDDEALHLLDNDIAYFSTVAETNFWWFVNLDQVRSDVIVEMLFNLGLHGLKEFAQMLTAVSNGEFQRASVEMMNSAWANQVGDRARELAAAMATGKEAA